MGKILLFIYYYAYNWRWKLMSDYGIW